MEAYRQHPNYTASELLLAGAMTTTPKTAPSLGVQAGVPTADSVVKGRKVQAVPSSTMASGMSGQLIAAVALVGLIMLLR